MAKTNVVAGTCLCTNGWNGKHCTLEGCPENCNGTKKMMRIVLTILKVIIIISSIIILAVMMNGLIMPLQDDDDDVLTIMIATDIDSLRSWHLHHANISHNWECLYEMMITTIIMFALLID